MVWFNFEPDPIFLNPDTVTAYVSNLEHYNGEYILVSLASVFGVLNAAVVVLLLAMLAVKTFQIAFHQKNRLGMILGCGCGSRCILHSGYCSKQYYADGDIAPGGIKLRG